MRRKPSRLSTGRLKLLRLFSTLLPITLTDPVPNCSAIESRNASPEKDQSRKSESFALDALSALWTRDRAGGTAPRRLRASAMPRVQTGVHFGQADRLTGTWILVESGIT